jgi:hypothetical protein
MIFILLPSRAVRRFQYTLRLPTVYIPLEGILTEGQVKWIV